MAIKLTDTGVRISHGRGKAAVGLDVSFKQLERWAKRQRIDTPRLMQRSFGRAAFGLKKKFYDVMRNGGGVNGVPKFKDYDPFTVEYRMNRGVDPHGPIGGILGEKANIVAYKRDGGQVVGWPDKMEDLALKFQDGAGGARSEAFFTVPSQRAIMHRRSRVQDLPRQYAHNPRPVVTPYFENYVERNLIQWAKGAFYKELARQMQKGSVKI